MASRRLSYSYVCLHILMLTFQTQGKKPQSGLGFERSVGGPGATPSSRGPGLVRVYQLYSRTSGRHVQIRGTNIAATAQDGGKYAKLLVESDTFGGRVRIQGAESGHYLCMNRRGQPVGKLAGRGRACVFTEVYLENNYTALRSVRYRRLYLGFSRSGAPRPADRKRLYHRQLHFLKRPLSSPLPAASRGASFRFLLPPRLPASAPSPRARGEG